MIRYLGSYTVGGLFPTMVAFTAGLMPRLRGMLGGALRLNAQASLKMPSVQARVSGAARVAAALALQGPQLKLAVGANANVVADLRAQLAAWAAIQAAFGAAGVEVFLYEGSAAGMGSEVADATRGGLPGGVGSDTVHAFIVSTRHPSTFTALGKVVLG
jgi:hypothetical protein